MPAASSTCVGISGPIRHATLVDITETTIPVFYLYGKSLPPIYDWVSKDVIYLSLVRFSIFNLASLGVDEWWKLWYIYIYIYIYVCVPVCVCVCVCFFKTVRFEKGWCTPTIMSIFLLNMAVSVALLYIWFNSTQISPNILPNDWYYNKVWRCFCFWYHFIYITRIWYMLCLPTVRFVYL